MIGESYRWKWQANLRRHLGRSLGERSGGQITSAMAGVPALRWTCLVRQYVTHLGSQGPICSAVLPCAVRRETSLGIVDRLLAEPHLHRRLTHLVFVLAHALWHRVLLRFVPSVQAH